MQKSQQTWGYYRAAIRPWYKWIFRKERLLNDIYIRWKDLYKSGSPHSLYWNGCLDDKWKIVNSLLFVTQRFSFTYKYTKDFFFWINHAIKQHVLLVYFGVKFERSQSGHGHKCKQHYLLHVLTIVCRQFYQWLLILRSINE